MRGFFLRGASATALAFVLFSLPAAGVSQAQRKGRGGKICFDPTRPCRTAVTFEPNELPFVVPQNTAVSGSEPFFAVILKSVKVGDQDCEKFIPEGERLEAQKLFPNRKVFASRRCGEPGNLYYTSVPLNVEFMAVYGGATQAEAMRTLAAAKAIPKYAGAYVKKMRADFNGT
jgi:hypothetical protein